MTGHTMIGRVSRILGAFSGHHPRLTLSEIAAATDLPVSTIHRQVNALVNEGFLERDGDDYVIGIRLWEIGELAPVSLDLRERAIPFLLDLYQDSFENVHLAVRDGFEALYVARLIGASSVPTLSRVGGRHPLHTTGVGKALLAESGPEYIAEYLDRPLARPTRYSLHERRQIAEQLELIRRLGYSRTDQEMSLGATSLAVPIRGSEGEVIAAVGVVSHLARMDVNRVLPRLQRAARGISGAIREQ